MESLSKSAVDGREKAQGLVDLAVLSPYPSKARPTAQLHRQRPLLPGDVK
jgi:hypothetical protein